MEPIHIYYKVMFGLLAFVLVFGALYNKFGSKKSFSCELTLPRELSKEEIDEKKKLIVEKHMAFMRRNDKAINVFLSSLFGGFPFFIGLLLYNNHTKTKTFSFTPIQLFGLVAVFALCGLTGFDDQKSKKYKNTSDRVVCFLVAAFLLPAGIELSRTQNPNIFGSTVPQFLSFLFGAILIGLGVMLVFYAVKTNRSNT